MLYAVKYGYVDNNGNKISAYDAFNRNKMTVTGAKDFSDRNFCAYFSKASAGVIAKQISATMESLKQFGDIKKFNKVKVVNVKETDIPDGNLKKAVDNAAFRYYFSLCL